MYLLTLLLSSAADFMIGIYLLVVAIYDVILRDEYNRHAFRWLESWACATTGCMAMLASEVSIFILATMSVERLVTITFPYKPKLLNKRRGMVVLATIWLLGAALALTPMTSDNIFGNFYGSNGVCFPLHIHEPYKPGWQYSAFVFIGINSVALCVVAYSYIAMFVNIKRTQSNVSASKDTQFAKRFFVIVLTDLVCWIPIIIVKILALSSVIIPGIIYREDPRVILGHYPRYYISRRSSLYPRSLSQVLSHAL